jgi:hypothetical protein
LSHRDRTAQRRGLAIAGSRLTLYEIMDLIKKGGLRSDSRNLSLDGRTIAVAYDYFAAHGEEFEADIGGGARVGGAGAVLRARQVEWERTMVRPPDTLRKRRFAPGLQQ